ncbi:TPA: hypothetical protein ACIVGF_002895 [Salmonella enterica subsp. enterica serovar 16:l,v:-]|nr:hypothetical protein [Salmonella enterica]
MNVQTNPYTFKFLANKKNKKDLNNKEGVLLNRVLKNKVTMETYSRIENHDDFNHALKTRVMLMKLVPLPCLIFMGAVGYFYIGMVSFLLMLSLAAVAWLILTPIFNRNLIYAVPSVILWGFVYDCTLNAEFKDIFRERLYSKDILFKEDLDYLHRQLHRLFEKDKAQCQKNSHHSEDKVL